MKKVLLLLLLSSMAFAQKVRPKPFYPILQPVTSQQKADLLKNIPANIIPSNSSAGGFSGATPTPSPEVAQANHLQDIPVNKYTGTPIIKIPIYTLNEASLSVPIVLNYNASGVRGHAVAGWTGLGWDLEGIPMLNRIVKGLPDEGKLENLAGRKGYYNYGRFVSSSTDTDHDKEPDVFFLTAGGASYRFMFDEFKTPHFFPESDIKVDVTHVNNPHETGTNHWAKVFTLFKFTMPDGTQYHFTNTNTEETAEVEVKTARSNGIYPLGSNFTNFLKDNLIVSSWYLSKVVSSFGHEINFSYNRVAYTYYKLAENEKIGACPTAIPTKLNKVYIRGCQISTITSLNTKIDFNTGYKICSTVTNPITGEPETVCTFSGTPRYDIDSWGNDPTGQSDAKKLISIQISDNVANPTQSLTYSFDYGYFTGTDNGGFDLPNNTPAYTYLEVGETHKKRLKLTRVTVPDGNHYDFTYKGEENGFNFKTRFTYGIDHWGYINGADGNINLKGLIGNDVVENCANGSNREADITYTLYGALLKVSNTMGSETALEYEAHRANNYGSGNTNIGGLRIKKLTTKDLVRSTETIKEYSYLNSSNLSTGFLFVKPIYRFDDIHEVRYSNSSVYELLLNETGKTAVGYNQVNETVYDSGNTTQIGKTSTYFDQNETELSTYRTTTCLDGNDDPYTCNIYQIEDFLPNYDFKSGSLLKEENRNQSNQLLNSNEMVYTSDNGLGVFTGFSYRIVKLNNIILKQAFYHRFAKYRVEQTTAKTYSQDGTGTPQTTTVEMVYKDEMPTIYQDEYKGKHNQVVKTITTDSYGYTVENLNKYAFDFNFGETTTTECEPDCLPCNISNPQCQNEVTIPHIPPSGSEPRAIYELNNNCIGIAPIETITKRNGKVISAQYLKYYPNNNTYTTLPKESFSLRVIPKTTFSEVVYNGTNETMVKDTDYGTARSEFLEFNTIGLPTEIQVKRGATSQTTYDTQNVLPLSMTQNFGVSDALTTTYEYIDKFRGISKQIMPNNTELRYEYYSLDSRLKNIKDKDGKLLKRYDYDFSGGISVSNLSWDNTRRTKLCSGGQITLTVYVNGLISGAIAQFSTDGGSTWNNANVGDDGYAITMTPNNNYQSFKARASDNPSTEITTQYHASCTTRPPLAWSTNSCTNINGTCNFFISVTGLATDSYAEFSIDGTNWFRANVGDNGYNVSVPYGMGGGQGFNMRASEDHSVGDSGSLTKCQ